MFVVDELGEGIAFGIFADEGFSAGGKVDDDFSNSKEEVLH